MASHAPTAGEVTYLLAPGQTARSRAEEREYRARRRTARGLLVALVMIWGYDLVLRVTGLHT
jgi:hypothetical protein